VCVYGHERGEEEGLFLFFFGAGLGTWREVVTVVGDGSRSRGEELQAAAAALKGGNSMHVVDRFQCMHYLVF
jgi:hypothetical protein